MLQNTKCGEEECNSVTMVGGLGSVTFNWDEK